MALLMPTASRVLALKNILNHTAPQSQTLFLYSSNTTPDVGDVIGTYTETTGGGYASKALTGSSWSVASAYTDDAEATYATQTFTFTGAVGGSGSVIGYGVKQTTSGALMWAEKFASAFVPANNGDSVSFVPTFRLGDLSP